MEKNELKKQFSRWSDLKYYFPYKELTGAPKLRLLVITCMDCRIVDEVFGVTEPGQVTIIRNAGALVTPDSLRSTLIAVYELGVKNIAIVGHTHCGGAMSTSRMNSMLEKMANSADITPVETLKLLGSSSVEQAFLGFNDVENQVIESVLKLRRHPLIIAADVKVEGFVYDTENGIIIDLEEE
ncbi:MAG: carbonic anhydrase [Candidatus Heimdallarchaeota archaeon]|nr:carbonic anhydrase [Candidatus Heimdallarchaeota archaeon]